MAYLAVATFLMGALFVIFAPGFLFIENIPRQADAVVLFVGPENVARLDEARQMIKEGYARYLLIPYSGVCYTVDRSGSLVKSVDTQQHEDLVRRIRLATTYKKHYENTHIEALEAKRMLDDLGLRSAMLVSSGYHIRRISMIAGRVFDDQKYTISFNSARWQTPFTAADWLNKAHRKIIVSEYVKMVWFLAYGIAGY
jgi:uncharacterized SAM-binding protein YcdF (DUF218 family)